MKIQKNNSIGTKTYTYVKFIATIGSIILLIVPLISLLYFWKGFLNENLDQLNLITFLLWSLSLIVFGIYFFIRQRLFRKTTYIHTNKEKLLLNLSFYSYSVAIFTAVTYISIANFVPITTEIKSYLAILFISLVLIANTAGAIFESFSRIGEQKYLYDQNVTHQKTNNLSFSNSGVKRTNEAQEILHSQQRVEIDDEAQVLEKFFRDDKRDVEKNN